MAKRGIPRSPGYVSGSHWADCDSCGFQFREEDLLETWDGRWVDEDCWEVRHPQDFLRIKPEQISVDDPLRLPDLSNLSATANFSNTSAVAGVAEAGLAICGTDDGIPTATFGLVQGLVDTVNPTRA